jgi:hypothetical protein
VWRRKIWFNPPFLWKCLYQVRVITIFPVFLLLTDFVCLYTYEFCLSLFKNCDKYKLDKIILKVPTCMSKYVPIILRTENVLFGVLSQHFFLTTSDVKTQQSPHKRCRTLRFIWICLCDLTPLSTVFQLYHGDQF